MNWSTPDGVSYNDATDEHGLDRTTMSTFPYEKKEEKPFRIPPLDSHLVYF